MRQGGARARLDEGLPQHVQSPHVAAEHPPEQPFPPEQPPLPGSCRDGCRSSIPGQHAHFMANEVPLAQGAPTAAGHQWPL